MTTHRLAAILAADVVGFSALMGQDEEGTLSRIKGLRREVIEPKVQSLESGRGGVATTHLFDGSPNFCCSKSAVKSATQSEPSPIAYITTT